MIYEAVVKIALKRLGLNNKKGRYKVPTSFFEDKQSIDILEQQSKQNEILLNKLYSFICSETKSELTEEMKEIIQLQFYNYLLSYKTSEEYSLLISQFIMKESMDSQLIKDKL